MKTAVDLNQSCFDVVDDYPNLPSSFQDYSVSKPADVTVHFRDLEQHLIGYIRRYPLVVGCVAWLTNPRILAALADVQNVALVVQKEDFLRPDIASNQGWALKLRDAYDALQCNLERYDFRPLVSHLSICGDPLMHPVRCMGNYNEDKIPAFPRMHNKFLVFCDSFLLPAKNDEYEERKIVPKAVWTGSFNFTLNAAASLENALFIDDPLIANSYFNEWQQIEAMSEPLNWEHTWMAPEWRIGT